MRIQFMLMVLLTGICFSCSKTFTDLEAIERNDTVLERVTSNIGFFQDLAFVMEEDGGVAAWTEEKGKVKVYWDNGRVSTVWPDPAVEDVVPPTISATLQDGRLVWVVNGETLLRGGRSFSVTDSPAPILTTNGRDWVLSLADDHFSYNADACVKARRACMGVDASRPVTFRLVAGTEVYVEQPQWFKDLKTFDINRAFYKDIFLDAGVGLTTRKVLLAAKYLNLTQEFMTGREDDNKEWQRSLIGGSEEDTNGRLLYPDGQPRYRVLFVNGGGSVTHGNAMGDIVRSRMRSFYEMGGSYVGTCAGARFASGGSDSFLHIWPGIAKQTGITGDYTDFVIVEESPLLQYFDFGGDHYIEHVRQNKGSYSATLPVGTEILARYVYPSLSSVNNQPSVWAYKASIESGRAVLTGGHPEEVSSGERRDLAAAMVLYAMDGQGLTPLKAILRNGRIHNMTDEGQGVGDLQCHHFAFWLPEGVGPIDISVVGEIDCDWALNLSRDGYAYPDTAEFSCEGPQLRAELPSGLWYLSVKCMTTVNVMDSEVCQEYSGRTDVLNGVPYSIIVKWEE